MQQFKRASSTDVARLAGVSQSAVSRAFSQDAPISLATREKVHMAAATLGYRPNALASSLVTRRTNIVALMTGDIANPHYARTINSFSLALQERGLHVLLFSLIEHQSVEAAVEEVLKYRVDGVIFISAALSAEVGDACQKIGVPVVLYNRYAGDTNVCSVRIENAEGGRMLADHLVDRGHHRIGFIAGTAIDPTSADREAGFTTQAHRRGAQIVGRVDGGYSFEGGRAGLHTLMASTPFPTAIFAASDLMAFGAIDAARHDLGLRVPDDIAIVGFDDLPAAAWPSYDLTTIRQPVEAMAGITVELLLEQIEMKGVTAKAQRMAGTLIVRGSSGPT
jgi:DNA-binding LacI/PurR family transcriptional regulator